MKWCEVSFLGSETLRRAVVPSYDHAMAGNSGSVREIGSTVRCRRRPCDHGRFVLRVGFSSIAQNPNNRLGRGSRLAFPNQADAAPHL